MRPPDTPSQDALAPSAELAGLVERFEGAWQQAPPAPDLDAFLPTGGELRARALLELALIDLEYRLKSGEPARAEDYLDRYPALSGDPEAAASLIAAEYELRRRREPGLLLSSYGERFPAYADRVYRRLAVPLLCAPGEGDAVAAIDAGPPSTQALPPGRAVRLPQAPDCRPCQATRPSACSAASAWGSSTRPATGDWAGWWP